MLAVRKRRPWGAFFGFNETALFKSRTVIFHGRTDTATGFDVETVVQQRHFHAGDRTQHGNFVHVADVADTEDFTGNLGQTGTQRDVVFVVSSGDDVAGVFIGRYDHGRDGVGLETGLSTGF